jgi:hypothetical protein
MAQLPPGILPPGIQLPAGTDIMQFCRDLAESGAEFSEQFERDNPKFHNGVPTPVPLGGSRVPDSMLGSEVDWRALPEAPLAIEEDFGPEYNAAMAAHKQLGECKKAISVLNKPVEMAMRVRLQYKGAEGEDRIAMESRMKGAENTRDGALAAATQAILHESDDAVSERTRNCVKEVVERGKFHFEDKETFGEYMQVLQRANQAIFADQKKLLAKLKDIKKAAKIPTVTNTETQEASSTSDTAVGGA